jgi:hypothetical protein
MPVCSQTLVPQGSPSPVCPQPITQNVVDHVSGTSLRDNPVPIPTQVTAVSPHQSQEQSHLRKTTSWVYLDQGSQKPDQLSTHGGSEAVDHHVTELRG